MSEQAERTEQAVETYYEIRIPATIIVHVEPDELYPEEGQSVDDALLAYIAELIESPSQRHADTYDTELDYYNIDVDQHQRRKGNLPLQIGDTRAVRVTYERLARSWGAFWAYVARFVDAKP